MTHIIYFANLFCQLITGVFLYNQLGNPKRKFISILMLWIALMSASHYLFMWLGTIMNTTAFFSSIEVIIKFATCIPVLMQYNDTLKRKIIMFLVYAVAGIIAEPVTLGIICAVIGVSPSDFYSFEGTDVLTSVGRVISCDILVLLIILSILVIKRKNLKNQLAFRNLCIMISFMSAHFIFLCAYYRINRDTLGENNNILQLFFQTLFFLMVFFQYFNSLHIARISKSEQELQNLKLKMDSNYKYYTLAEKRFVDISKLRHDIKGTLSTVKALVKNNENEKANNIINTLDEKLERIKNVGFCSNTTINAVLSVKLNEKDEVSPEIQILLKDCDALPFNDYDICNLISNMYDNAYESCMKFSNPKETFIDIKSAVKGTYFILRVTNSAVSSSTVSDKKDSGHGYGLQIAEEICKRNNGYFSISFEEDTAVAVAALKIE